MERLSQWHTVENFEPGLKKKYNADFTGSFKNFVKVFPGGWVLPAGYKEFEKKLYEFKFRPDDVVVMTYPKCGTTWTQEIVWTMCNNPNLDHPDAAETLFSRSLFLDFDTMFPSEHDDNETAATDDFVQYFPFIKNSMERYPGKDPKDGVVLQLCEAQPSPRTLKTHLPFSVFDKSLLDSCKVVYVARNPKDVVLSYQHNCRLLNGHTFVGSQDTFVDYFVDDMVMYGSYAEHLKEAWQLRHHPNLLWVFYEDLKKDTLGQLRRLDAFMGTELTEAQLLNVQQHTSFSNMKANDPFNKGAPSYLNEEVLQKDGGFLRVGQVGSWKGKYTAEQERKIDDWIKKNFEGHGLQFTYQ